MSDYIQVESIDTQDLDAVLASFRAAIDWEMAWADSQPYDKKAGGVRDTKFCPQHPNYKRPCCKCGE